MSGASFEIVVSDYSTSVEEWRRAQHAPASELPELSEAQKEIARKFKISAEDYARGVLAGLYGQERMKERAGRLGQIVQEILDGVGRKDHVAAVIAQMFRGRWLVQVRRGSRIANVAVPRELGDDALDSRVRQDLEELKSRVLYGLGLSDTPAHSG